jgi:hypothetical protein
VQQRVVVGVDVEQQAQVRRREAHANLSLMSTTAMMFKVLRPI